MRHIVRFESYSCQERLDDILDKISRYGKKYLTPLEFKFLNSFSEGNQDEIHNEIKFAENETLFEDDQGYFKFEYKGSEEIDGDTQYKGTIYVPDLELRKSEKITGSLDGYITKHNNGTTSIYFEKGGYDIFEFCEGLEYELDSFIDYIISEIDQKMSMTD